LKNFLVRFSLIRHGVDKIAAQKKKSILVANRKRKKPASSPITEHISHCPTSSYPEDKGRQDILKKNVERMGCAMLGELPWRCCDEKMLMKIVAWRSTSFLAIIWAKLDDWTVEMWSRKWLLTAKRKGLPPKKENLAKCH
jgi:hypothetical protein